MSTTTSIPAINQEDRLILATEAVKNGQSASIRAAARSYDVPSSTLAYRINGRPIRRDSQLANHKLTSTEETTLVEWILSMDERGLPPRAASVRRMADLLLANRASSIPNTIPTTGQCWVRNFVKRHPELQSKYSRKYDYQRAQCEDPEIIQNWFRLVQNMIAKYGILAQDIYNFDETGFQMGIIATAKVITRSKKAGRPTITQPGNREWVTAIEAINSTGWALPPMIIFQGKLHQAS